MNKPRECGCKGCRTCLICENSYGISNKTSIQKESGTYLYCPFCKCAWTGWSFSDCDHPNHTGSCIPYPGVYIQLDFLTEDEEETLVNGIDSMPWDISQSGRRKQNFGPKCNFKKRKLQLGNFVGFPKFTQFVQKKFQDVEILKDFQTIEQCSLEYDPKRGASIDPHIDDCWIWGERIVTVNLIADAVLTMTYNNKLDKYNLDCVATYPSILDGENLNTSNMCYKIQGDVCKDFPVVRIPMPRRSLLVLYGAARYDWEHQVLREDITKRRVCLAYREFTPPFCTSGINYQKSRPIFEAALNFWINNET